MDNERERAVFDDDDSSSYAIGCLGECKYLGKMRFLLASFNTKDSRR